MDEIVKLLKKMYSHRITIKEKRLKLSCSKNIVINEPITIFKLRELGIEDNDKIDFYVDDICGIDNVVVMKYTHERMETDYEMNCRIAKDMQHNAYYDDFWNILKWLGQNNLAPIYEMVKDYPIYRFARNNLEFCGSSILSIKRCFNITYLMALKIYYAYKYEIRKRRSEQ